MEPFPLVATGITRRISVPRFLWKRRNLLKFLEEINEWVGDYAEVKVGRQTIVVVKHPDLVQQLLAVYSAKTTKGRSAERQRFFSFLGDGLLNSEGESHRRQRRLVLSAFHRSRIAGYGRVMVESAHAGTAGWQNGEVRDLAAEMMKLTLAIVGRALFSSSVVDGGSSDMVGHLNHLVFPGATWVLRSPLPFARRIRHAKAQLDDGVYALIRDRRKSSVDTGDLLSTLLLAEDAERPGERLSDLEVRDQVMTFFFAGQETTANALTWIWWLLTRHPKTEAALHAELAYVLNGRDPAFSDIDQLTLTNQIVTEALRLYPPVWTLGRQTLAEIDLGGHVVPSGSLVLASQWLLHRDPRWFADPAVFRPERWTPEFRSSLPRFAYFPFGGGPRSCLGEIFAWTEIVIVVATVAQHWRFIATSDSSTVRPLPRITLGPDRPVHLAIHRIERKS